MTDPLYSTAYFRRYLKVSIEIFQQDYPWRRLPFQHEKWGVFISILKVAKVQKVLIYEELHRGNQWIRYGHAPISENSPSEEYIRRKYRIVDEVFP